VYLIATHIIKKRTQTEGGVNDDNRIGGFDSRARGDQPDRNCFRVGVTFGLLRSQRMDGLTALFLVTNVAPARSDSSPLSQAAARISRHHSLVLLAFAMLVAMPFIWPEPGGEIYSVTAVLSLWLMVFFLIAQLFMKVPALHPLPNGL